MSDIAARAAAFCVGAVSAGFGLGFLLHGIRLMWSLIDIPK